MQSRPTDFQALRTFIDELNLLDKLAVANTAQYPEYNDQTIKIEGLVNKALLKLVLQLGEGHATIMELRAIYRRITSQRTPYSIAEMRQVANATIHRDFHQIMSSARLLAQLNRAGSTDADISAQPIQPDLLPHIVRLTSTLYPEQTALELAREYRKPITQHAISAQKPFIALANYVADYKKNNKIEAYAKNRIDQYLKNLDHTFAVLRSAPSNRALKEAFSAHEPLARDTLNSLVVWQDDLAEKDWFSSFTSLFASKPVSPLTHLDALTEIINGLDKANRPGI